MAECKTVDFFLGANTPNGFRSYFSAFDEPKVGFRRYLIKGGPGTGKSGMMKRLCEALQQDDRAEVIERIHCSSDVDSLDGVIWDSGKAAIFDATLPHAVEPKYPGAYDRVISLTECFDNELLKGNLDRIVPLSMQITALHRRCQQLLAAAELLSDQNRAYLSEHWQMGKLRRSADRFAKRLLFGLQGDYGEEKLRMLTAVTNQGVITYDRTVETLADRVICIKDPYGVVSGAYLDAIRRWAKKQGLSAILCLSPFETDRVDHILLPEARIAVLTEDLFQKFTGFERMQFIHVARYLPEKQQKGIKSALRHRNKMILSVVNDAVGCLKQAKQLHDKLESYYTPAVDFEQVDRMTETVIREFMA